MNNQQDANRDGIRETERIEVDREAKLHQVIQNPEGDAAEDGASPRTRLNRIARRWTPDNGLPEFATQADLAQLCWEVLKPNEADLQFLVYETELTLAEAQAWVLRKKVDRNGCTLTDEAVAMCLSVLDGFEEIDIGKLLGTDIDDWVHPKEVRSHLDSAESKHEKSIERMAAFQITDPSKVADSPRPIILDMDTFNRLSQRSKEYGEAADTTVRRLLDKTETQLTLKEAVQAYLDAVGRQHVRAITVPPRQFAYAYLIIKVHAKSRRSHPEAMKEIERSHPEAVKEIDAILVGDQRHDCHFNFTPYGPAGEELVRLYTSEGSDEEEGSLHEEGFEQVREIAELADPNQVDDLLG